MHHHNHFYGHSHILAKYCGFPDGTTPPISGYVQHGWNVGNGWSWDQVFFDGAWRYVWSEMPARRGHAIGLRDYHVIGAPFLYLDAMVPPTDDQREGTIFFLFHGWEWGELSGDHQRLIDQIRDVETGPVTISLYLAEYERPEIRQAYESAGFAVTCFGRRGWAYRYNDPDFLWLQLAALRRHKRVAANRLSTAIWYGAAVGCEVAVYGDPMTMEGEDPVFGGVARLQRLWPAMFGEETDFEQVQHLTDQELGRRWLLPPDELRTVLYRTEPANGDAKPGVAPVRTGTLKAKRKEPK